MAAQETDMKLDDFERRVAEFHISDPGSGDPHLLFSEMRRHCPVARSEAFGGFWVLTQYDDVRQALRQPETFSSCIHGIPPIEDERAEKIIPLNYDPPEHGMYRKQFSPYFAPNSLPPIEPGARARIRELLQAFVAKGGGDFIADVAVPYPCLTFLGMLGLPLTDLDQLLEWKDTMVRDLHSGDPDRIERATKEVIPKIYNYFEMKITARMADDNPPDDVLTAMARARYGDREFTLDEKVRTLDLFFQAGLDTVTGVLGLIAEFLASHTEHRRQLIEEPQLTSNAVEEFLRYFGIVTLFRKVMQDTEVHGVPLAKSDLVMMLTQSAGRDETAYADADVVDFRRSPIHHLGFGAGPHRCIGSHLARMELRVALEEMSSLMPEFEMACDPDALVRHWGAVAGLAALPLTVPSRKD